jgi:hypothetical protein
MRRKKGRFNRPFLVLTVARLTTLAATLAWIFLVVGGCATLKAALLALGGGETHAGRCHGAGGCFTICFGAELFGHEITPDKLKKPLIISALERLQANRGVKRKKPARRPVFHLRFRF